jgi:ribosomal protein L22
MTPSKPGNPSQGKPAEAEKAEVEAAEAKQAAAVEGAQEKAEAPAPEVEVEETPETEASASDELEPTAADEAAADAAAEEEEDDVLTDEPEPEGEADEEAEDEPEAEEKPKPRRRSRAKKEDEAPTPAPKPARERVAPGERVLVRAQAKYVRTSARKARLVCDHIRGKSVLEARAILALTPRHVARDWSKLLESAVANAENNHELIGDELRIASVTADEGPTLKRYRPRAMGRATRIRKRTSHLTILLTPKES